MAPRLKPFQKAIYFPEDLPSGATIGYHCTVVDVWSQDSQFDSTVPDVGFYRVFVHHLARYMVLPACELFGLAESDSDPPTSVLGDQQACEMRFDHPLESDNETISGAFRLPGRQWESFHFRKWDLHHSGYQLARPVCDGTTTYGILSYHSPRAQPLNRSYILTALAEIFGRRIEGNV